MLRVRSVVSRARMPTNCFRHFFYPEKFNDTVSSQLKKDLHQCYVSAEPINKEVEKLLAENTNNKLVLYVTGIHFQQTGEHDRAINSFERLNNLLPSAEIYTRLGDLYRIKKNHLFAEKMYQKAIELEQYFSMAHLGLGTLYTHQGRSVEAEKHFKVAYRNNITFDQNAHAMNAFRWAPDIVQDTMSKKHETSMSILIDEAETAYIGEDPLEYPKLDHYFLYNQFPVKVTAIEKKAGDFVTKYDRILGIETILGVMNYITSTQAGVVFNIPKLNQVFETNENFCEVLPLRVGLVQEFKVIVRGNCTIDQAAALLKNCRKIVIITGYSPCNDHPRTMWSSVDPLLKQRPSVIHNTIAHLYDTGLVSGVITQSIDGLLQKVGVTNVVEMYGSLSRTRCTYCQIDCGPCSDYMVPQGLVDCPCYGDTQRCFNYTQKPGKLRPDVALDGERVRSSDLQTAVNLVLECDAALVVDWDANVAPTAELPFIAWRNRAIVVELNKKSTRLSSQSGGRTYFVEGDPQQTLPELISKLK